MSTVWSLVASFALPAPLALLVLLNLPLPKPFRRGIYIFVSRVLDVPIVGIAKLIHVMLLLLGVTFFSAIRTLQQLNENHQQSGPFATPKYEIMYLSKRWRSERNLWLTGFAFSMWAVLALLLKELGRRMQLEDRLVDFEMSGYTMTADETTKEPSISKEVTSKNRHAILSPRSLTTSPVKPRQRPGAAGAEREENIGEGKTLEPRAEASPSPVFNEVEMAQVGKKGSSDKMQKKDQ